MWQSVAQSELRTVNTVCDTEGSTRPALPGPALPLIHCTLGNWPAWKVRVLCYDTNKLQVMAVMMVRTLKESMWTLMDK